MSQATKTAWRRVAASLFLLPALAQGGNALYAQTAGGSLPASSANRPADPKEEARLLLKQGRIYLQANDVARAKQCALVAQQKNNKWEFYDDTPERLLADIACMPGSMVQPVSVLPSIVTPGEQPATLPALTPVGGAPAAKPAANLPADPRLLMKMGRDALKVGNIDLAKECGAKANASATRWGLFEDSPRKLLDDVAKVRAEKDRNESEKLLLESRKLLAKGEYDNAAQLAHKSERLHGPYSMWDLGDRPSKVLAEVEAAKLRNRKPTLPPAPTATVANNNKPAGQLTSKPELSPVQMGPGVPNKPVTPPLAMTPSRQQALAMMAECRMLQRGGKLVEARGKAIAAQRLNADYAAGEDRPEVVLMELNQQGVAEIAKKVEAAMQVAGTQPTVTSAAQAQGMLAQAKQFALGMGLDSFPIDEKASWLGQVNGKTTPPMPVVVQPAPSGPAPSVVQPAVVSAEQGKQMLAKARLELRNGQTDAARRLAETVYGGPYGMQSEAAGLLRYIEVEEQNQKILRANDAYNAGMAAFQRGEHSQALNIFLQIDGTLLTNDKRALMKEKMHIAGQFIAVNKPNPQLVPMTPTTSGIQTTGYPDAPPPIPGANTPGTVRISDQPGVKTGPGVPTPTTVAPVMPQAPGATGNFADQVKALQKVEFQRQRADGLKLQREAQARFTKGETDAAIQMLTEHLAKLKETALDPTDLAMLQRPVEYRLQTFKVLKAQRDAETHLALKSNQVREKHAREAEELNDKRSQCADLMKQFNKLYEEGKFEDAEVLAMKAHELDPESDAPTYAQNMAKIAKRVKTAKNLKDGKEQMTLDGLNDTDDEGKALTVKNPVDIDPERWRNAQSRGTMDRATSTRLRSEREKEIERKLSTPITVDFSNTPLSQVLKDLQGMTRINMHTALEALRDEQVNPNAPVSLKVDAIPLKSALAILLRQAKLTYVIADDVLQVTTEKAARGKLVQKVYSVADLVIPIDNFAVPNSANLMKALDKLSQPQAQIQGLSTAQSLGTGLGNAQQVGQASMSTMGGQDKSPAGGSMNSPGPMAASTTSTLAKNTLEEVLMKLITNTVAPQSWADVGGSGQIDYFPLGMALVINQTPDVQEQVADLLNSLRRLQDLEVAVEVRIVTVAETFFERIGLDFALNIKTDKYTRTMEPMITSGQFKPAGYLNDNSSKGVITGLTPAGSMTPDLDVPIKATSFNMAIPPFGYPNLPGANGGLSLGLAFLNDIQVFMFMEAAQGDKRTNVMQAPKLTLFNGQTSTMQIQDFQFFVTAVSVISVNGQIVFSPTNTPLPVGPVGLTNPTGVGINLAIQAVVSADRRYVRLNMNPVLSSLASATVPLFPITTFVTPTFEGGFIGQPIPFTQFIQQPSLAFVNIATTVSVPDGGTVLLGGLKSLSEGRNEFGPPVLSKIPYINRLVKNTGYGREASSLMIMVTPRIIINAEESERQTGSKEFSDE